ncbi:DUF922 domain-containing protein [Maribacter algarum]|uniref:DUF922 domain-containing protein n=1 Tax=Maribacter algarum (ex Zhang et al. 2020) TaxID=2578118 RepID=A0A5S3PPI7_9FLAO|nr:DUF922 domain-containing protein [Maribacter algarum]
MLKFGFGLVILLLLSFQQSLQGYDTITWSAEKRLSWKDFKGKIPPNNRAAATTASGITYRFSTSGTKDNIEVDFKIDTYFYPTKSWYQPELCDEVILSHEQLHFDISELYARKLRKRLGEATFTHGNVKAKVRSIYRKINIELNDFQNKYDDETNFSRDREQQLIWNEEIAKALLK